MGQPLFGIQATGALPSGPRGAGVLERWLAARAATALARARFDHAVKPPAVVAVDCCGGGGGGGACAGCARPPYAGWAVG
eukprot:scaffold76256_cov75-Phaeocystis_antarctica.AAC.4